MRLAVLFILPVSHILGGIVFRTCSALPCMCSSTANAVLAQKTVLPQCCCQRIALLPHGAQLLLYTLLLNLQILHQQPQVFSA